MNNNKQCALGSWPLAHLNRAIIASLLAIIAIAGCRKAAAPVEPIASAVPARVSMLAPASAAIAPRSAEQAGMAQLRAMPEYRSAQAACKAQDYARARDILDKLSKDAHFTKQQAAFCVTQENICRSHLSQPPLAVPGEPAQAASAANASANHSLTAADADCGPRALQIAAAKLGVSADLNMLRKTAGTTGQGTDLDGLSKAAASIGLKATGLQISREALAEVNLPAICWDRGNHFIVFCSYSPGEDGGKAVIRDPNASKEETISGEQLLRRSAGYILELTRAGH